MIRFLVEQEENIPIPKTYLPLMKKVIRTCVAREYPEHRFQVDLTICGDETIHGLNKEYRGVDRPTDVLSFPMLEFDFPDVWVSLGSIVISEETARRQAAEYGHSLKRELCFLAAHSALHLLGYDHETDEEREEMEALQREILHSLGIDR